MVYDSAKINFSFPDPTACVRILSETVTHKLPRYQQLDRKLINEVMKNTVNRDNLNISQ